MLSPNIFNTIFVFPILNLLILFYKVFLFIRLPGAFGLAIISLTVLVRILLHPFFRQQLMMSKKMQDMKPHLDKLSLKHKNDKKQLQQEQLKLYQRFGINPASGCLFMIVQIPIFIALYNTLSLFFMNGNISKVITEINKVVYSPILKIQSIDPWFFGINLASIPSKTGNWIYLAVPVITGILQYMQTSLMTPAISPTTEIAKTTSKTTSEVNEKKDGDGGDFQKAMNTQMKYIFPFMIGWFSYTLPIGLSLYWNIFSIFSIMQYRKIKPKS